METLRIFLKPTKDNLTISEEAQIGRDFLKYFPNGLNENSAIEFLQSKGYIRHLWHKDDITERARQRDIKLTRSQVDDVASLIENKTDCEVGVNWDAIDVWIDYVLNPN